MGHYNPPECAAVPQELVFLVLGAARTGKSSTCNTLTGRPVFETRGGEASRAASAVIAGRPVRVVDSQRWGSTEEFVPREEKIELLRAVSHCGRGPHVFLLVVPLLDFTESEARAVERRMEILPSVWRHTVVLFTFGDRLRGTGRSVKEHIQSGGPALRWLMEKCRYRYHVFDNKTAAIGEQDGGKVKGGGKKEVGTWRKRFVEKGESTGGDADGRGEGEQEQVRELLSRVEDMLEENGGWHYSLHMYQRLEEEWSRREQELRARLEAEENVGGARRRLKTNMEQGQETEEETQENSLGIRQESKEDSVEKKMNRGEGKEGVDLRRLSSEEESSDSGGEAEDGTETKAGMMASCRPHAGQRLAFTPGRRLA